MSILEQVIESKNSGLSEDQIITNLKEQGISPDAITAALDQARIKTAISSEDAGVFNEDMESSIFRPERAESLPTEGIISDIDLLPPIPSEFQRQRRGAPLHQEISSEESVPEEFYAPAPEEADYVSQEQQPEYTPQYGQPEYMPQQPEYTSPQQEYGQPEYMPQQPEYASPQQEYGQPEYMPQQPEYGYPAQSSDTDTVIEIAEQVFSEKIKSMQKQVEVLNELKTLTGSKMENISDRLKRIEANIDRLQAEILEKVGSYGRGLDNVQKEMSMMQNSFGKMVGNLAERTESKHYPVAKITPTHTTQRIVKKVTVVHKSGKKRSKKK